MIESSIYTSWCAGPNSSSMSTDKVRPAPFFPLLHFASLLGVHTTLLVFTALYLPRSSFLFTPIPPQASSRDRPQRPFLRPLTADPTLALIWLCLGTAAISSNVWSWYVSYFDTISYRRNISPVDSPSWTTPNGYHVHHKRNE